MDGVNCGPMGAVSHAMEHVMAAAMAGGAPGMHHPDMMTGHEMEEMWAHDFVMQQQAQHMHHSHHQQQHHHHQHHHFDPTHMASEAWEHEFDAHHNMGPMASAAEVHEAELTAALEAAYESEALAAGTAGAAVDDWLGQFEGEQADGKEWADDYNNPDVQTHTLEGEPLRTVAEKDAESKFHGLMTDIQSGAVIIEEPASAAQPATAVEVDHSHGEWANEYEQDDEEGAMRNAWRQAAGREAGEEEMTDEFLAKMRALEAEMHNDEQPWADEYGADHVEDGGEWMKEYEEMTRRLNDAAELTEYPFEQNNPYLFHDHPFMEGQELLAAGTLSEAVLAFEAACQKDPTAVEHWQFLGTTQAENEKDALAIIALNAAKKLCPTSLDVLSSLAVSHTNEANHRLALRYLREWIAVNDKYQGLQDAVSGITVDDMDHDTHFAPQYLFVDPTEHKQVTAMFEAAQVIDPSDVEVCKALGVLHNLSNEYDKAAQNFRDALKLCPDDEKLWNKLGATLANGNRPREAVDAYNRALDLNPGFVRAQYNLGVAHQSMGDYQNAARQFIRAIVMQQGGVAPPEDDSGTPRSATAIWDILRMTFNLMDKPDLVQATWTHDVRPFLADFGLSDIM